MEDDEFQEYLDQLLPKLGKTYVFDDKDSIELVQIKRRDSGPFVTYHVRQGPGIPRKLVMRIDEFAHTYGHLFNT
jgi:hypothetical protein